MTTHSQPKSDEAVTAVCTARITGLNKYATAGTTISIQGKVFTLAAVIATYQRSLDTRTTLTAVRAQEQNALDDRNAADTDRRAIDKGVLDWAVAQWGPTSPQAKAIGYVEPAPATPTVATRAAAAVKAAETRKIRGTVGKRQKAKIVVPTAGSSGTGNGSATPAKT